MQRPERVRKTRLAAEAREAAIERGAVWLARYLRQCGKAGMILADLSDAELDALILAAFTRSTPAAAAPPYTTQYQFLIEKPGGGAVYADTQRGGKPRTTRRM